ncbi:putative membrane protein [Bacillus clarus]|uniref:Putative membrane protein n=1 Tax=Bacillus clarus TaxID=2338372 RepID=A0A090YY45_9BACI|nr:putative membrane protein [Bacillus clarus]
MSDIIRLFIVMLITIYLFFSVIMEFKKPQKSMFWFSIEVLFLLGMVLLIKEFFIKYIT